MHEHAELLQQVQQLYHRKKKNITKKLFPTKQTIPETRQYITPRLILVVTNNIVQYGEITIILVFSFGTAFTSKC